MSILLLATPGLAATLYVGPSDTYTTINSAVSASASGDTIVVRQGTYAEDLDLRGRNLTIRSEDGPRYTILSPTQSIKLDAGTLEGFTIDPAPGTGVYVSSGSPTLSELLIMDPATYGVEVAGGSPTIVEVYVYSAGTHGFIIRSGTPTVRRCIGHDSGSYNFDFKAATTVQNSISIGANYGFVWETTASTLSNIVALDANTAATAALTSATITNGAFEDNT
jgi:hypothetical protein